MYTAIIVDDEPLTREYFKKNITSINPNWQIVAEASDGAEALDLISKKKIDLLITDIKMPVMDGLELCRKVLKNNPKQKVIILSGHEEFDFAKEAIELGVFSHTLKPIVKLELKKKLDKITQKIKTEEENKIELDRMISISKDLKKQVIEKFLKAIISDSYLEIKSLYPILFKMKENLIDSEGIIMILRADEDTIIKNNISISDIPIIKLLLKETASNIVEDENRTGKVFSDKEDNTTILLNIPDISSYTEYCKEIFNIIYNQFIKRTKIDISGSIGSLENEILQLNLSYNNAYNTILNRLICGENKLYVFNDDESIPDTTIYISRIISSIKSGVLDNNEISYMAAISKYLEQMSNYNISEIFRFGIHLIKSLKELTNCIFDEKVEESLKYLKNLPQQESHVFTSNDVLQIFKELVIALKYQEETNSKQEEIDYITKAKDYIYIHYAEPISLALVAEEVCVSASYLSNIFHEKVGESYIKFLTKVRMEQAARLLKNKPELKIYRVAEKVGYISVKHFSYIFKNYFNQTPTEYQENHL